jgi:hypothetical protein
MNISLISQSNIWAYWLVFVILLPGCYSSKNEYPFMVVGFPVESVAIFNRAGKEIDRLNSPWIFTHDQIKGTHLPLNYQVYHNPWKESVFVLAESISFCPKIRQTSRLEPFYIHHAQEGTLEGAVYRMENEKVYFRVAIDMGPNLEFIYRCQNRQVESLSRREW